MMNTTITNQNEEEALTTQAYEIWRWVFIDLCILTSIIGVFANGLVIFFYSSTKRCERYGNLNRTLVHLAVADLLYSIFAAPLELTYWDMGKIIY